MGPVSSVQVKWPGRDGKHTTLSTAEVTHRVQLYLYRLTVSNSGDVPAKATETLYKDFRIEYSVVS
jgi:hypothetical protein